MATSGRHARPPRRQLLARRRAVAGAAVLLAAVLGCATEQVAAHGWHAFTDRPPGVGSTPADGR